MEDVIMLARLQFAVTTIYHFFFVPLTIGLAFLIAIMETLYVRTNNDKYKKMTKFWGKLFLINFAMGVATGLVQEFQFGMNWSDYSRYVGDIFGVPLAVEALLAFFLESTFLGIWIFGWEKVNKKIHLLSIWIVSIATLISAFWILSANSFMQHPAGYVINNGRAEMTNFMEIVTNPYLWVQFPHTISAALSTGGFFVLGISAYHLLKKNNADWVKSSLKIGIITSLIFTILTAGFGDLQGKYLAKNLPMKMAAAEALWESQDPAPFSIIAVIDENNKNNDFEISIPKLLSFMSYNSFSGKVEGLKDLQAKYEKEYGPGNYIPPVTISFYAFRAMISVGMLMILLSLVSLFLFIRKKLSDKRLFLKILTLSIALPFIANTTGWLLTEVSRTPWIVFGLLRLENAISPTVSVFYVLTSLIVYVIVYTVLIIVDISLMVKFANKSPLGNEKGEVALKEMKEESLWI